MLWELEARTLKSMKLLNHAHIVKCIAAIRRGDSRYFLFPWADGDSLRDYWESTPRQSPQKKNIYQTLVQLRGLADALDKLHNFNVGELEPETFVPDGEPMPFSGPAMIFQNEMGDYQNVTHNQFIRHGDLKPENILNFQYGEAGLGRLKIADIGLAKQHIVATEKRSHQTSTRYGTTRYEAPETVTAIHARSRLYDIWSMGCITLEFIIWNLYGNDELLNFYAQVQGNAQHICPYFEVSEATGKAEVHSVVRQWLEHILNTDPECSQESAIRDLLKVVQTRLLVVRLPLSQGSSLDPSQRLEMLDMGETITSYRATARQFYEALEAIISKTDRPNYLLTGKDRKIARPSAAKSSNLLSPLAAQRKEPRTEGIVTKQESQ